MLKHAVVVGAFSVFCAPSAIAEQAYDPSRNGKIDLQHAIAQSKIEYKPLIVVVGGDWCPSCLSLAKAIKDDAGFQALLTEKFVFLKINYSAKNKNKEATELLPFYFGYPAVFVFDPSGRQLKPKSIFSFEKDGNFDLKGFRLALLDVLNLRP